VQRLLRDMGTFTKFTAALGLPGLGEVQPYQLQLARVVVSIFTLLSVNAGLIYAAEHGVNPDIQNYFSALYFGLTTLTTVGFGDITPVTWQGKLVVGGSILAGVTIIPAQAALLVEALLDSQTEKERASRRNPSADKTSSNDLLPSAAIDANTPCPSCGATFHWTSANYCWSCGGKL
jgi:voltage-gated potassium channel